MLNMYLMAMLDETIESKIEKDENGLIVVNGSLNESTFKFNPIDTIKKLKDDLISKISSNKTDKDDFKSAIDDYNLFLSVTTTSRVNLATTDITFAKRIFNQIDKYKNCDKTNDLFAPEVEKLVDSQRKIIDKRADDYGSKAKGDWRRVHTKEFQKWVAANPVELKRFKNLQDNANNIGTKIIKPIHEKAVSTHNMIAKDLMKNRKNYSLYQISVIDYLIDLLKNSAIFSLDDYIDTLSYIVTVDIKPAVKNESAFLTEAAKDEEDADGGDDNSTEEETDTQSEDNEDTATDDNTDDTNSDDDNQDDNNDDNSDDENKDDENNDDSSSDSDDEFSLDSDDSSSEDDGENPDGLNSPDAMGDDESTQDTETNVHVNILNLSKLDRTLSLKRLLNDYTAMRTSINTFLNIIDKNETVIDATLRETLTNDLNKLQQNLTDYIGIKFSYINYEENLQNYIIFSKSLEEIVQRLQSTLQHKDK